MILAQAFRSHSQGGRFAAFPGTEMPVSLIGIIGCTPILTGLAEISIDFDTKFESFSTLPCRRRSAQFGGSFCDTLQLLYLS